ncbi:hypothetical protein O1611_g281 [Lasiodiplodia mahajangana]|uniref:Uncharacterized protein n=1 Tax=Lasiodiplodia mahajangana TaxID=1108764 RepID=A0ACC2K0N0_9PEZI|nr:hypothetical protein O1611_g281 [Lasiodiplodia mahajangana]
MPIIRKYKLRRLVPTSGMKYQSWRKLMHSRRRDKRVADALKAAGYEMKHAVITRVLVNMFRTATPIVAEGRANGEDLWDILPRVQLQIDWARTLPQPVFFELVACFVEARHEWEKAPVYPFDYYELYNPMVLELIKFRKSIGDYGPGGSSWVLVDAVFFNELARGFNIDEDEDDAIAMSCITSF